MTITLPLPDKRLSPNHTVATMGARMAKASATKKARQRAYAYACAELGPNPRPKFSSYTLAFFHATNRKRDDDNLAASCKAYRDGIADALGMDDHGLVMAATPTTAIDKQRPRVEITLI